MIIPDYFNNNCKEIIEIKNEHKEFRYFIHIEGLYIFSPVFKKSVSCYAVMKYIFMGLFPHKDYNFVTKKYVYHENSSLFEYRHSSLLIRDGEIIKSDYYGPYWEDSFFLPKRKPNGFSSICTDLTKSVIDLEGKKIFLMRARILIDDTEEGIIDIHGAAGIDFNPKLASKKCIMEAVERHCLSTGEPNSVIKYNDVCPDIRLNFPYFGFSSCEQPELLTEVFSYPEKVKYYIPAELAFNPRPKNLGEKFISPSASDGCAASDSFEDALLRATRELIERDAYYQAVRLRRNIFPIDRNLTGFIANEYGSKIEENIFFTDITTDLGVKVYHALLVMGDGCGHGASSSNNFENSIRKSTSEAIQTYHDLKLLDNNPTMKKSAAYSEHRKWSAKNSSEHTFFLRGDESHQEIPGIFLSSLRDIDFFLSRTNKRLFYKTYYCEFGYVVRVFISGILPCDPAFMENPPRYSSLSKESSDYFYYRGSIFT